MSSGSYTCHEDKSTPSLTGDCEVKENFTIIRKHFANKKVMIAQRIKPGIMNHNEMSIEKFTGPS